jgi:hypothetical protein
MCLLKQQTTAKEIDMLSFKPLSTLMLKLTTVFSFSLILAACGGSSGSSTGGSAPTSTGGVAGAGGSSAPETINYSGPAPRDADVQNFRSTVWSQLALSSRCGACHVQGGSATPAFVRTDDVNAAYDAAISLINLTNPSSSRLVTKVLEPHNCWLTSANVCGDLIEGWIQDFAGSGGSTSFLGALNLTDPALRDVGQSKQFPAMGDEGSAVDFASTVYPLLNQYCGSCHAADSGLQQQPFLGGNSSDPNITDPTALADDIESSYEAARSRINLGDSDLSMANALSRLVVRLRDEGHNCWNGSCANSATAMHAAIQTFSNALPVTTVDPDLVVSRALTLDDGQTATTGGRVENNVIAQWNFSAGSGGTAFDVSGIEPALDLNITGNVEWLASGGVRINDGKLQGLTTTSAKLYDRIIASGEFSIEAWVVPLNVTQDGPARIATYSGAVDRRNFMLGQTTYDYNFLTRSSVTDSDGQPALSTPMADEVLQATLQHVVVNYSATEGRSIYVNGELVSNTDAQGPGNFNSWDRNFAFVIGDEVSNDNQWQGSVRLMAIRDRVMPQQDIQTNFDIGVGQKFYLLFSVESHVNIPRSYVVMQVELFDDYGYLFNEPFFVSLDPNATITDFPLQGMRVGINGQELVTGQAYSKVNTTVTQAAVTAGEGRQILSTVGTIVSVDQGSATDEFFLTFEQLGGSSNVFVEGVPTVVVPTPSTEEQSDIGIKTFDEINEALSSLTGIVKTNTNVANTFDTVRQQLPVNEDIEGFAAAQQMAVTQLAVIYCKELVDQEAALDAGGNNTGGYFPNFDFGSAAAGAFDATGRSQVISPLMDRLLANTISTNDQPTFATAEVELDSLISTLLGTCSTDSCSPGGNRVNDIVTATCASAFGSGMMLIQ